MNCVNPANVPGSPIRVTVTITPGVEAYPASAAARAASNVPAPSASAIRAAVAIAATRPAAASIGARRPCASAAVVPR